MSAREAMIVSAATLFRERGVAATSLRDVVEHAGAPRGSIYHHFPGGKAELAVAATTVAGGYIDQLLAGLLESSEPADAVARFVAYWQAALTRHDFADGCPVAAAAISPDDTTEARSAAGEVFARWQERIAATLTERGLTGDEAADLAGLTVAAVEGAIIMSRAQRSTEALDRVARQLTRLLAAAR